MEDWRIGRQRGEFDLLLSRRSWRVGWRDGNVTWDEPGRLLEVGILPVEQYGSQLS